MGGQGNDPFKKMYGLIAVLIVLQAAAIGLVLRFTANSIERDKILLDRTGAMIEQIFPGLQQNIGDVSRKATQIRSDISGLRDQVSQVDEHVGDVKDGVTQVGSRVAKIDSSMTTFIDDTSGLIWGHSLNPYVLIALLTVIIAAIPASTWLFTRRRLADQPRVARAPLSSLAPVSASLDRLHALIERFRSDRIARRRSPELQKLMIETERLIREAKNGCDHNAVALQIRVRDRETDRELN